MSILVAGCAAAEPAPLELPTLDPTARIEMTSTVIEDETGVHACHLILESLPPQCGGGFAVVGFEWDAVDEYEENGGVRWGEYDLVVTYNGTSLRLVDDPAPTSPPPTPAPEPRAPGGLTEFEVKAILDDLRDEIPDLRAYGPGNGFASITVVYDDGSLQRQLDARYGVGAVEVESLLPGTG